MLTRTLAVTRYRTDPRLITRDGVEAGQFRSGRAPSVIRSRTVNVGWCDPTNYLLPPTPETCKHEPWWWLGLRIDTWSAPAGPLKAKLDLRKRDWLAGTGRDRVPKAVVEELKEGLYGELAVCSSRMVHVCIHLTDGLVLLGGTGGPQQAALLSAWHRSWDEHPERAASEHFGTPRFLLWLWWRLETGRTELERGDLTWDLWVDAQMEFEGGSTSSRIVSGSAGSTRPSYASLTAGLLPSKLRLGMSASGTECSVMLSAPADEVRSIRYASPPESFDEQMIRLQETLAVLDALGAEYARIVDDPDRQEQVEGEIDAWKADWNRTLAPAEEALDAATA